MDKEQAINLAKRYKEMVAEKLPLKALYLYGSYSKGNYRADSDIDIAVIVVNPEKPDVPLNKNDAFQKVQKRRVQEKR